MKTELRTVLRSPRLLRRYRQIFLLSHMRANTSLLGHLFGASPDIEGYYEMHIGYYSWKSRWRQKLLYFKDHPAKPRGRYIFDKVLHNEHKVAPMFLADARSRVIFSLRQPELTIPSLMSLYRKIDPQHEFCEAEAAFGYYTERLHELERLAACCEGRYCYLDAQSLRDQGGEVLSKLSDWLGLERELDSQYEVQVKTGVSRAGDHSANLRGGKIITEKSDYSHISLKPKALANAQSVYTSARNTLIEGSEIAIL
jgi:hypothetical protein